MQVIIDTITKAMQDNLATVVLMLIVVDSLNLINILFGTVVGTFGKNGKFDIKKFLFGFLKALLASAGIFALCYVLNLFALVLQLTNDITISTDFITTAEVIIILVTWAVDLIKDIVEKVKSMRELKYISYEDVQRQVNQGTQEEIG